MKHQSSRHYITPQSALYTSGMVHNCWLKVSIPLLVISNVLSLMLVIYMVKYGIYGSYSISYSKETNRRTCKNLGQCKFNIVESIPENLTYPAGSVSFPSTFTIWRNLLKGAKTSLDMGEFYFSLRNEDVTPIYMPSSWQGEEIFKEILDAGRKRNIHIRIAQNEPSSLFSQNDTLIFAKEGGAQIRSLNFNRLMGSGVLHTKMWIIDQKHVYIGSANMDWQSLTQVKELGIVIQNCSCIAHDMQKIFEVYWYLGRDGAQIPDSWPEKLNTDYNITNPMMLTVNNISYETFVSSSPPPFNPKGRTNDIDAIVHIIRSAEKFVYVAVMDYFPRMLYNNKGNIFWPVIDNELRQAALERGIDVRLMASHWNHTRPDMVRWMKSLEDISGNEYPVISIKMKLFVVPSYTARQRNLTFARVNHNKYMVTDKTAYIGTSNWCGDYFTNTAGVSISISENGENFESLTLRMELQSVFERDWSSKYAKSVDEILTPVTSAVTSNAISFQHAKFPLIVVIAATVHGIHRLVFALLACDAILVVM